MTSRLKQIFASFAAATVFWLAPGTGFSANQESIVAVDSGEDLSVSFFETDKKCRTVRVKSDHSHYIGELQKKFGRLPGHVPLVILDHDEIERCQGALVADGTMTGKFTAFNIAVFQFVQARSGLALSSQDVKNRALDLMNDRISAETIMDDRKNPVLTVLVPGNPDVSVYDALLDFVDADHSGKGYDFLRDTLRSQNVVVANTFLMWGDVHEIAHGLDPHYTPQIWKTQGAEMLWQRHKAESYADVVSVLYLAHAGKTQGSGFARFIADLRTVNTLSGDDRGDDQKRALNHQLNTVYYTAPSLRSAANYISSMGDGIKDLPIEEVLQVARGIVEENALSLNEMRAIISYMDSGKKNKNSTVEAYGDETLLAQERLKRQIDDYYDRSPTQQERQEMNAGIYTDLMNDARLHDKNPEAFARRIAQVRDELRGRFIYGASTMDEEETQKHLEDVSRAVIDFGRELAEKNPSGAKPPPKPSPPRPRH